MNIKLLKNKFLLYFIKLDLVVKIKAIKFNVKYIWRNIKMNLSDINILITSFIIGVIYPIILFYTCNLMYETI